MVLEAFYLEHLETVQRFVARRVSDPHTAADLTAEVFLAAMAAAGTYEPTRGRPVAWLYGIARNVVASEVRRQVRQRRAHSEVSGHRVLEGDALLRIEERLDAERRSRELYRAMAALSARDRGLIELVDLDGLPVTEAAAVLGVKPATARVRLHRARTRIKSNLPLATPAALTQEV